MLRHPLLRYALAGTLAAGLAFLMLSGWFTAWEGHVVSLRPSAVENPSVYTVLIVTDAGDGTEVDWPASVVEPLNLRADPTGTPPNKIPDNAAMTKKSRFSLFYTLTPDEGPAQVVPTTSARALSVAVLLWVVGLFLYNMYLSGSPFSWTPAERRLPELQDPNLQMHRDEGAERRATSKPGPPPPRRRRGQGRRR